ncbi:acyltransferase family protein [Halomonas sp. ZH2S]|uniref:Acyltransferase family protein n=1 Tax=Vreelandella zhuhanensis TaxID=2684210 RepID=A0A7X3GZ30_9GAMM|nr:acyltransferase family protein [Halomonas zhuhanensis]MWJ27532.1 acyltransferase family protein [Halomonas zhuhanensis]
MKLFYRPEVDGLRAVAVIPVVLYHAGFDFFNGGYVGVDVFFVISGYLITNIIYNEMVGGNFSLIRFYERRARRILPALFFITMICLPFAWMWMLPNDFKELSQSIMAVNAFVSNIFFWQQIDYFAGPAELKPLLHTWSLAVEEQFYVFFPLFLLFVRRLRKEHFFLTLLLVSILSLGLAEWGSRTHPSANFYLLPTRAWELLAGAMIAIALHGRELRFRSAFRDLGAFAGLAMILYSVVMFDDDTPFPSLWTLIPVMGTSLVILFSRNDTWSGRWLGWKPIVGIGLMSYSIYLWHQPVFVFAREKSLVALSSNDYLMLCVLTLVLSYFSWRFVEKPFRNKAFIGRNQVFAGAAGVSVLLIGLGLYGAVSQGVPGRLDPRAVQLAEMVDDRDPRVRECQVLPGHYVSPESSCVFNGEKPRLLALWGDSQAGTLVKNLERRLETQGHGIKQLVHTNCLPIVGYRRSDGMDGCTRYNEEAIDFLIDHEEIEIVVMAARYPLQFEGKRFDNREGGVEAGHELYAIPLKNSMGDDDRVEIMGQLMRDTVRSLLEAGKKVMLVYPIPEVGWNVPIHLAKEVMYGIERTEPLSTSHDVFVERVASTYHHFDQLEDHKNLVRVKPESVFCNTFIPDRCTAELDGKLLYYDSFHLNNLGSKILVGHLLNEMAVAGWVDSNNELLIAKKKYAD